MEITTIGELTVVIFAIVQLVKRISFLKDADPQIIAIAVAFLLTVVCMWAGILPKTGATILQVIASLFGAAYTNDKLWNPVRDSLRGDTNALDVDMGEH